MAFWTDDLMMARSTMAFSLGFHIIFASVGMVMPFFMAASHFLFLKRGHPVFLELTKMWSKGVAVLFATGAVSGTVLSFELGLLWPGFMVHAGPIIGMPFSWEGTAFFLEAIAIGIFFYGWNRLPPWLHWASGLVVGIAGLASGIFVIAANSWMNTPAGFEFGDGKFSGIDPVAAMFNRHWPQQSLHMLLAAFTSVGFAVAGIHALLLLRGRRPSLNRTALHIALTFGAVAALLQPLSGHHSAQEVARNQPMKLAAMEAHFETAPRAPLWLGGWPDVENRAVNWGIPIPGALSFLAFNDFSAEVHGLDQIPREDWPSVPVVHAAFQIMVGLGTLLALVGAFFLFLRYVRRREIGPRFLKLLVALLPTGFIALEAGWTVTEVGRQPWIIYGVMRTADAVSPMPGLGWHFLLFLILYVIIGAGCVLLLGRLIANAQKTGGGGRGH